MIQIASLVLGFDDFLTQYGNNPRYELADGELIDMEPTGSHESVGGKVASQLSIEINRQQHPWIIPRTCLRCDAVVGDRAAWRRRQFLRPNTI